MDTPLISIVIPTYNSKTWIEETINSALNQEGATVEIVIVDDGSTDETKTHLAEKRLLDLVTYVFQENSGVSVARNRGMEYCQGEYVCFLDSDDILRPTFCHRMVKLLEDSGCKIGYCNYQYFLDVDERPLLNIHYPKYVGKIFGQLISNHCIPTTGAVLLKRDTIASIQFDPDLRNAEDWKFWIDLSINEPFAYSPEVLIDIRFRRDSLSRDKSEMAASNIKLLARLECIVHRNKAELSLAEVAEYYYRYASVLIEVGAYRKAFQKWMSAGHHRLTARRHMIMMGKMIISMAGLRTAVERMLWNRRIGA